MRLLIIALLLLPLSFAATTTFTAVNNTTFFVAEHEYSVTLFNENGTLVTDNVSRRILRIDQCLVEVYEKVCLTSASETQVTLTREFLGPVLKATLDITPTTLVLGGTLRATITLTNSGIRKAKDVVMDLNLPEGVELDSGESGIYEWTGTVEDNIVIQKDLEPQSNGSFSVNGTVTYFDQNATKVLTLATKSFTVTTPFSYIVGYNASASKENSTFSVNVTKKDSKNYTVTITIDFPSETVIEGTNRHGTTDWKSASMRSFLNSSETKLGLEAYYRFTGPPSEQAVVSVTYENDSDEHTLTSKHSFNSISDEEPSLAAKIDPLVENTSGLLQVVITGNRSGALTLSGALSQNISTDAGTHEFVIPARPKGNYTLGLSFTSIGAYGEVSITKGTVRFEVKEKGKTVPNTPPLSQNSTTNANTTTTKQQEVPIEKTVQGSGLQPIIWIAAIASLSVLAVLFLVLRKFKDPLHKLEVLVEHISEAAELLEEKRLMQGLTKTEEAELRELQKQLRKLEEQL